MVSVSYFFSLVISALFAILFIYWGVQLWKISTRYARCKTMLPVLPGEKEGPSAGWAKTAAILMWLFAISPVITSIILLTGGVASVFGVKSVENEGEENVP